MLWNSHVCYVVKPGTKLGSICYSTTRLSISTFFITLMVSHVWMWQLDYKESWAPKNWCFWTVVLEKTLESPLDCKEIQPVHPKEISPEYSLEELMPKLKLQYLGHLTRRADSSEKTLMLGKIEGRRRGEDRGWDGWMASPTWWTWVWVSSGSRWWTGRSGVLQSMGLQSRTWLSDWTNG